MVRIFIIYMKKGLLCRTAPTSVLKTGGTRDSVGGSTSATRSVIATKPLRMRALLSVDANISVQKSVKELGEQEVWEYCDYLFELYKGCFISFLLKKDIKNALKIMIKKFELTIANAYSFELENNDLSNFSKEELNSPFLRIEILNEKIWDLLPLLTDKNRYGSGLAQLVVIDTTNYVVDVLNSEIYNKLFSEEELKTMELIYNILCDDNEFMFQVESGVEGNYYMRWFIK